MTYQDNCTLPTELLEQIAEQGLDATDEPIPRSLTLDQMAAHIGTTREMVCRLLYRFSDQKLIHITRTEFVLNNRSGFVQLTGQDSELP